MDFLTNPFTTALLFLYQLLGQNIVLTIIVFTLLIRLLTFPLTYQQIKSTKMMQAIQPQLKEIQEKYKGDREKLAAAQMELYQKNGVNPFAGCLPLVVQFPILIGLYAAISRALAATPLQVLDLSHRILIPGLGNLIPLQNSFWVWNLALPDATFILTILVVASSWLQQKLLTPTNPNADPKDPTVAMTRNMTVMMPLMVGFFSTQVPSGLTIYWIVGNLASILQYAAMGRVDIRNLFGRPAPTPAIVETTRRKGKAEISGPAGRPTVTSTSGTSSAERLDEGRVTPAKAKAKAKARAK